MKEEVEGGGGGGGWPRMHAGMTIDFLRSCGSAVVYCCR